MAYRFFFFLRNNLKIFFSSVNNNYDNCNILVISKMEFEFLIIYIYIERIRVLQNAREVIGTSRCNKLKR